MNSKTIGIILIIAGVILAALSLLADYIGLSANAVFGYKQIAGLVVGILAVIAAALLLRRQ